MRLLCVLLPHFPLRCESQRQPALKTSRALVTYTVGSQRLVLDYSPELRGLQRDMPLQGALGQHGEVELVPADMPHYRSAFNQILDSLEQKCPLVEGSEVGCVYLGLNGLEHIHGSDESFARVVLQTIPHAYEARLGVAEGKFTAYLAALYSHSSGLSIVVDDVAAFLKDIPCDVLPVSQRSKKKLRDFGLHTLGQVAGLPQGPVQAQFGPEGKRIWELARGYDDTPLYLRHSEEVIEESMTLPSMTVSLEAILAAVESLLTRAFSREKLKGKGVRQLILWAQLWRAGYWERNINFKEPAMNARAVLSRVKDILLNSPAPGPVEEVGLKLTGLSYERCRQESLFSEVRANDQLQADIAQLGLRLGGPQVFKLKEVEPWSRIPERRRALTPLGR